MSRRWWNAAGRFFLAAFAAQGSLSALRQSWPSACRGALVAHYTAIANLGVPTSCPRAGSAAPDDDHVIAAAVAARATLIVTGDGKHLLPIGSHRGIATIEPTEALRRIISTNPSGLLGL